MPPKKRSEERIEDSGVEAVAIVTMMEAANSAREDVRAIMAGVRAVTAAKQHQRELLAKINRDVAAAEVAGAEGRELEFSPHGLGGASAYERVEVAIPDPESPARVRFAGLSLVDAPLISRHQLEAAREAMQSKLDSMSEMGEMESLRLQMAMDRLSRLMETLSNLMKKMSDSAQTITRNLR